MTDHSTYLSPFSWRYASPEMRGLWSEERKRGTWHIRTETYTRLTATKTHWVVWGRLEAFEGKKKVFEKEFNEEIERKLQ